MPRNPTVITVRRRNTFGGGVGQPIIGVFGPFTRDELSGATQVLQDAYPNALLKRYQLKSLPTTIQTEE